MIQLSAAVQDFVQKARNSPAEASDPAALQKLLDACEDNWDGRFTALNSPVAPLTWEAKIVLPGAKAASARVPFNFPNSVEVVGFRPTVIAVSTGLVVPTTDDLEVSIDKEQTLYYTQAQGTGVGTDAVDGQFVTLSAIGVQVPRLWGIKLTAEKPLLGFTLRWKRPPTSGAIYDDALIGIAMYCRSIPMVPVSEMSRTTGAR